MDKDKLIWVGTGVVVIVAIVFVTFNTDIKPEDIDNNNNNEPPIVNEEEEGGEEEEEVGVDPEERDLIDMVMEAEEMILNSEEMFEEVDALKVNQVIYSDIERRLEELREDFNDLDRKQMEEGITNEQLREELEEILERVDSLMNRIFELT